MRAKLFRIATPVLTLSLLGVSGGNATAQVSALQPGILAPGSKNTAASAGGSKTAAEVRLQTQMQQRIQAQAQVLQRAQSQAQRGTQAAMRVTQQRSSAAVAATPNMELRANARGQANVGNAEATVRTEARVQSRPQPNDTEIDVGLLDTVFGRFNPFRGSEPSASTTLASATTVKTGANSRPETAAPQTPSSTKQDTSTPSDTPVEQSSLVGQTASSMPVMGMDLNTRVQHAIRLRRAEIAEVRDQALTTSNVQLLVRADEMESVLNTFVSAQTEAAAHMDQRARATKRGSAEAGTQVQAQGSATENVDINSATQRR